MLHRADSSADIPFRKHKSSGPCGQTGVLVFGLGVLSLLLSLLSCALAHHWAQRPLLLLPALLSVQCALLGWAYHRAWRGSAKPALAHALLCSATSHLLFAQDLTLSLATLLAGTAASFLGANVLAASPAEYHPKTHPHT